MELLDSVQNTYGSFIPDDGNIYLAVNVSVSNNGKTADTFLPSFSLGDDVVAKILYSDGYEFSATQLLGYDKDLHNKTLNPLLSTEGEIAFQISNVITTSPEEPLILYFSLGKKSLDYNLR